MGKYFFISFLTVLNFAGFAQHNSISLAALKAHVEILASDQLEGRAAGSQGGTIAANYIATLFQDIGLEKPYSIASYLQPFYMVLATKFVCRT